MTGAEPTTLGFLTVLDHPQHGLFGGYLLLNLAGRPIEFHCTAPVKANRAQEILYGPTLEPFLYGEHIGLALVKKATVMPLAICCDRIPILAMRPHVSMPLALVHVGKRDSDDPAADRMERARGALSSHSAGASFEMGPNRLSVSAEWPADQQELVRSLAQTCEHFDLSEPFERIKNAIEEAQRLREPRTGQGSSPRMIEEESHAARLAA